MSERINCKHCWKPLPRSQRIAGRKNCSRKCRMAAIEKNKRTYKKPEFPMFGVAFDYQGNSV